MDCLRNLQIRFISEKNFDVLDISDLEMVSNNEKAMDIIYSFHDKFRYWGYNWKNYLARLKQDASVASKSVYMIQTYFSLSGLDSDIWVLDITCRSYICNSLRRLQNIKGLKRGNLELYDANGESISTEAMGTSMLDLSLDKIFELKDCYYIPKVIETLILYFCC